MFLSLVSNEEVLAAKGMTLQYILCSYLHPWSKRSCIRSSIDLYSVYHNQYFYRQLHNVVLQKRMTRNCEVSTIFKSQGQFDHFGQGRRLKYSVHLSATPWAVTNGTSFNISCTLIFVLDQNEGQSGNLSWPNDK